MSKKVSFGGKPITKPSTPDEWVENRTSESLAMTGTMKRLTFDIPDALHRRIKSQCALNGIKMADALRELLEKHFPEQE